MGTMFLTHEEIVKLTGKHHSSAQRRVLNALGITHKTRPDGSIVVLSSHVQKEMGGLQAAIGAQAPTVEPNWGAL